jgi:hypothetical protein
MIDQRSKKRFAIHGYVGVAIIVTAEALLFDGNQLVGHWFTPIVWTGYVLLIDALIFKLKSRSLLMTDRLEFVVLALISIGCWWLFEFYNAPRFWNSNLELWWHYHNLEPNLFLRRAGYDWAFAAISPAMFATAELLTASVFKRAGDGLKIELAKPLLIGVAGFGFISALVPLLFPSEWFAPAVWLSFILFLDPVNALRGWPSICGDLGRGDWRRLWALLTSGGICGFLWEFWNYWSLSKWTYTVPYFGNIKVCEMPVLGFLGFPPFAVECWVMYIFLRSLLPPVRRELESGEIFLSSS